MSKRNDLTEKMMEQGRDIEQAKQQAREAVKELRLKVSLGQDWTEQSLKKANDIEKLWKKIEKIV
jgi:hypothetical protein